MMISLTSLLVAVSGVFLNVGPSQNMTTIFDDTYQGGELSMLLRYYNNAQLGNTSQGGTANPIELAGAQTDLPYLTYNNNYGVNEESIEGFSSTYYVNQFSNVELEAQYRINLNYGSIGRIGHDINFKLTSNPSFNENTDTYTNRWQVTRNAQYDGINLQISVTSFLWSYMEFNTGYYYVQPYIYFNTLQTYSWDLRANVNSLDYTFTQTGVRASAGYTPQWSNYVQQGGFVGSFVEDTYVGYLFSVHTLTQSPSETTAYQDGYTTGYEDGYANGLEVGSQTPNVTFQQLIGTIIDTPILYLRKFFGYEVFGVNMYYALATLMSLLVALAVFRLVRGIV